MFQVSFKMGWALGLILTMSSAIGFAHDGHGMPPSPIHVQILKIRDASGKVLKSAVEKKALTLELRLIRKDNGKVVTLSELTPFHEKIFHLFAYDDGLTNFVHEHPVVLDEKLGTWSVQVTFKQTGSFKLWANVSLKIDQNTDQEVTAFTIVSVDGDSQPNLQPASLPEQRIGRDGASILQLENVPLRAKQMAMINIDFQRADGTPPQITPYLGAIAHFVVTPLDGDLLLHVHPMKMGGVWMIHTEFPQSGDYQIFAQFVDQGVLKTVEMVVKVK